MRAHPTSEFLRTPAAALIANLTAPLTAQRTWVVDGNDDQGLRTAVQRAGPGDVLLVGTGQFAAPEMVLD